MKYISYTTDNSPGPLHKTLAIVATAALVTLGLMFSAVLLAVILLIGAMAWAYLWWKTREVRRQVREQILNRRVRSANAANEPFGGEVFRDEELRGKVIEGEVIRVDTKRDTPEG
jgi:hypothetical protein